ncbi:zinc finger protein 91 isoform X1 [Hypomesus transpacificus]|uniref:zinc finger protein 91 isoform X1 n=1 Tax=Hypomesus transpacificus TaxID=137520 RepID=UPI001F08597E|nr:zinc finger protein 91 isoform X1 [Hypomesus transpacificus]
MDDVTAIEIKEDGIAGDNSSREEHSKKMAEDCGVAGSNEDSTDWDGLFRCLHCGEVFEEEAGYLEHQHLHPHDSPVVCPDTGSHLDGLLVSKDDGQQTLCCSLCGRVFLDSRGFYSHMMKHRTQRSKGDSVTPEQSSPVTKQNIYKCQDCGKSYAAIGHFLNHQRSHKQASKSVVHLLAHLKKKSFQCPTCGRSYSRASALDAHRRCHEVKLIKSRNRSGEKRTPTSGTVVESEDKDEPGQSDNTHNLYECPCGKTFIAPSGLRTHQRFSHNDKCTPPNKKKEPKRQFHCSECEKTYSSRVALVSHQRWHSNRSRNAGKKFPCEECGKVFMTLTFYYKHQRLAHSEEETPAKSFLHQVCQLQKKAFECQDCGLRFSRASALQSHQLCHNDVFRETETLSTKPTSPLPQRELLLRNKEETDHMVISQDTIHSPVTERDDMYVNETDEDMEYYDTGDFNVEVISISASDGSVEDEDETLEDLNPDLELLCESDQEGKEEMETGICQTDMSTMAHQSKEGIDLKIVQIDFESFQDHRVEDQDEQEDQISFNVENDKEKNPILPMAVKMFICDICGHETKHQATHYNHVRKHEDRKPYKNVLYQLAGLEKNTFKCEECGKCFSRLSALNSHQQHHPKTKPHQCPDCKMSYTHSSGLYTHRKSCQAKRKTQDYSSETKKEVFNPKKTLLGPKVYHCEQCGKGFWSLGAYSHHKQQQTQCADLKERRVPSTPSLHPVNGRPRVQVACPVCGRKFRHRGIMKSHMRKHENGNHKCELCGRSFRVFSSLLRHQVVHYDKLLPPPIKSFQHQVEQVKKNTYSCPDCGKLFSRAKALQFHMKSHGYETSYSPSSPKSALEIGELQCSTCHAHFSKKSLLQSHQKLCRKKELNQSRASDTILPSSSPKNTSKDKTLKCPTCLSSFKSILSLQYHRKQCSRQYKKASDEGMDEKQQGLQNEPHDGNDELVDVKEKIKPQHLDKSASSNISDLKYKCKDCERSFAVVGALNFHKRIHLKGHKSKSKIKLQSYAVHKKLNQGEQSKGQFVCSECGRRFVSNAALGTHKRWHTDKKFAGSLVKDETTNSHKSLDDGPFHCNKCGKGFFYLCVLRRHQIYYPPCQTKAKPEPQADVSVEGNSKTSFSEFACPECNKTFVRGSLLAAHYESEHSISSDHADLQGHQSQGRSKKQVPKQPAEKPIKSEDTPSQILKAKAHQCPHCDQSFMKIRGLRAHKWQAHSKRLRNRKRPLESTQTVSKRKNVHAKNTDMEVVTSGNTVVTPKQVSAKKRKVGGKRRRRGRASLPPLKSIPCLDCGKRYSSTGALYNHRKTCLVLKQDIKPVKTVTEDPSPLTRLPEPTVKCLFKCHKCGKAFPTEERLGAHKDLAKSRPFCCALCCRGYWTETQLQQHLAWHDEVRRRLPTELRYRLSTTLTSGSSQLSSPLNDKKPSLKQSPMQTPVPRSQNSHKCQHCGKAFLSPAALHNHEAQHNSNDSYHCSLCPRTFSEIRDLIDHHQECMGDDKGQMDAHAAVSLRDTDGLTCLECGISFSQEIELHHHYIEHANGTY